MTNFSKPVVVIDNGSFNLKAGFACDNHPVCIFRNTVGRPKYLKGTYGKTPYEVYVGDEAVQRVDELDLNYPVYRGKIIHWDNMERVWHHVFYRELKAAPEDRAVLLSCAPTTTMKDKVKCCEIFFESLNSPGLCVKPQSVLSLFGSGCATGMSVDLGHDITGINPVYEGGSIEYANMETNMSAYHVSEYIKESLLQRDLNLGPDIDKVVEELRTKYVYVTKNCAVTRQQYMKTYKLPSGEEVDVSEEVFMAGELYFQPELVLNKKVNCLSLPDAILTSSLKCDSDLQPELFDAIVVHGGMTVPGLCKRLSLELKSLLNRPVNIIESSEAYGVAWMGGAVFAGSRESQRVWVTQKQFEEHGERIVRNRVKCCEIFFESLNTMSLCIRPQSLLALFGSGFTTGVSVDLGEDCTEIHPIYEGGSLTYANMVTNIAGTEIKNMMLENIHKRGFRRANITEQLLDNVWREAYITMDTAVPNCKKSYRRKLYIPGYETHINVGDEAFWAGEMYFQPELVLGQKAADCLSVQQAIVTAIAKCDKELQPELYEGIVVHGGMILPGFIKRLCQELELLTERQIIIQEPTEAYALGWLGGAVFAGIIDAPKLFIAKEKFEEQGERIVRTKFIS
uniref:SFRICE_010815 n=1 Tax=Spodoptera frugiperda TaxID=7108 RepID=A0A2H1W220_SPOFR